MGDSRVLEALTVRSGVRVTRRVEVSVDRLAVHPVDEVVGRECAHAPCVPGEVGVVVEEVAPLATRAVTEERGGIDPLLWANVGDDRVGPAAHGLERRRLDQAGPPTLVDVDAEPEGQLPHLPVQVGLQVVVVQVHDVEIGGVAERLQAPQRCAAATTRSAWRASRRRPSARSGPARRQDAVAVVAW